MVVLGVIAVLGAGYLVEQNQPFIREMTTNPTGLETISLLQDVPPSATLMLDWGPRYYATAFAHDLWGERPDIKLVTHKADFKQIEQQGVLVTADFTLYNRPISWWKEQIGREIHIWAAGPHLIRISTMMFQSDKVAKGINAYQADVVCRPNAILLWIKWTTDVKPDHDLSVYVHLLDKDGAMIAQADEAAPVYGWRPLTSWEAGELVTDVYALPRLPNADSIAYGLYRQLPSGEFQNEYTFSAAVKCG